MSSELRSQDRTTIQVLWNPQKCAKSASILLLHSRLPGELSSLQKPSFVYHSNYSGCLTGIPAHVFFQKRYAAHIEQHVRSSVP